MKVNVIKILRIVIKSLEKTAPYLAKKLAIKLFYSPRPFKRKLPKIPNLKKEWCSYKKTDGSVSKCRVYSSGNGPTVLLIHGWEGSAHSMSTIAKHLLKKDLRVVLFDLPAHGFSPDKKTNIVEINSIIKKITDNEEELLAIVSHSFGAVCAGYAIKAGIKPKHFVSIAAPTSMAYIVDTFCSIIGASNIIRKELISNLEKILKAPYETESLLNSAKNFTIHGLIIHDRNDKLVPFSYAKQLSGVWNNSRLIATNNLGHNGILKNSSVINEILESIS